jgi:hypothetical protein
MAEKMTAVMLIILTMIVCAAVPAMMIWLTTMPHPKMVIAIPLSTKAMDSTSAIGNGLNEATGLILGKN